MGRKIVGFRAGASLLATLLVAACASPGGQASGSPPAAPLARDAFAGLTYRLDLPAGWIVRGSSAYDATLDSAPDVARWLDLLDLNGADAFRAYEPLPGAAGMRLAINPQSPWRSAQPLLLDAGRIAALPGVTGEPNGEMVGIGQAAKATRFRWTETLDWGSSTPSPRAVVGYDVMSEFEPVDVFFSYPAGTDRLAEVEALMATFVVTGNPVVSLPPGVTMPPSPTPYDKWASTAPTSPTPAPHADAALEALLPDSVDGIALAKLSQTGEQRGMTDADPLLAAFGKHPADLVIASATPSKPPLFGIGVERLRGVPADQLLAVVLKQMPDAKVTRTSLGGRQVTYVEYGAWPVWYYATGDLLFSVAGQQETVAAALGMLP
jgi:hypothetical protein